MSLLKSLQIHLTNVSIPWVPVKNAVLARFINEIVVAEESDHDAKGVVKSHFEMYLTAMTEVKANTHEINSFIAMIQSNVSIEKALKNRDIPVEVKEFINFTFDLIKTNKSHLIAASFTFGREDVIPDMFLKIVAESSSKSSESYNHFLYYLKRHIELDGDEHGPLSLRMIEVLCEEDQEKWDAVLAVAKASLQIKINLWNGIEKRLLQQKENFV